MKNKKKKNGSRKVVFTSLFLTIVVVLICFLFVPLFNNLKFQGFINELVVVWLLRVVKSKLGVFW